MEPNKVGGHSSESYLQQPQKAKGVLKRGCFTESFDQFVMINLVPQMIKAQCLYQVK